MRLFLAPMEGVVDHTLRELMTAIGGIDICVTEFIRVTDHTLPDKVFYRYCPELHQHSATTSHTAVRIQLLGGQAQAVAANAAKAASLGASAIDLNFGCPAKTVNRNDGGAKLLKEPHRIYDIVKACREQVPSGTPVTAKMRLGFDDRSVYLDNALAAYEAGANELTVHARSKADGYRPPAYWDALAHIKQAIDIPLIANGEIWNVADYRRCRELSQCDDFMLGRGLLACPDLALQIKADHTQQQHQTMQWSEICVLLKQFFAITSQQYADKYMGNRLKQWLHYLQRQYPEAQQLFETIKRYRDKAMIEQSIDEHIAIPIAS